MNASNISFHSVSYKYCKYWKPDSDLEKNVKFIALTFLCVFGILSNIFIIILAVKYTVRKNLHHLIINMAVFDAIFSAMLSWRTIEIKYNIERLYSNVLGHIMCKIRVYLVEMCVVSLVTLLVISIERFRATRRTLQRPRPYTVKQRVAVLGICWLIPMIPGGYSCYELKFDEETKKCTFSSRWVETLYFIISFSTMISVIFIILTFSAITVRRLSTIQLTQARLNQEQQAMRKKGTRSAVSMVLSSVLLYACCWFPPSVLGMFLIIDKYFPNVSPLYYCVDWNVIECYMVYHSQCSTCCKRLPQSLYLPHISR